MELFDGCVMLSTDESVVQMKLCMRVARTGTSLSYRITTRLRPSRLDIMWRIGRSQHERRVSSGQSGSCEVRSRSANGPGPLDEASSRVWRSRRIEKATAAAMHQGNCILPSQACVFRHTAPSHLRPDQL